MKSLRKYINEKLIIKQKQKITNPSNRRELDAAILDHFELHDSNLNDINVSKIKKEELYCLFYNLRTKIKKYKITKIDISEWGLDELYNPVFAAGMFQDCKTLKTIILPYCIKAIGSFTFCNCENLDNITIPDSVISIGESAFKNCRELKNINLGNSLQTIWNSAFEGCDLTSIIIPDSVISICKDAFYRCSNLTSISIPNSVKTIDKYAFMNHPNLIITVPNERVKKLVEDSGFNGKIIIK